MDKKSCRIAFMGTPHLAALVLEELIKNDFNIIGVVAQPDRPNGRKKELCAVPTKEVAMRYNIPVFQPEKIRLYYATLANWKPDLILTLAYGQIVPQAVLDIPPLGALNLHGSLLPKYRGAAPMQYALINGDKITGMTLMEMVAKMDAGRMFAKREIEISDDDNLTSLEAKMAECAIKLVLEKLPLYLKGELNGESQDESLVTFAPSIKSEEEHLNLEKSAEEIVNFIRALSDHPGAYLWLNDQKIKIWIAKKISDDKKEDVGTITKAQKDGLYFQAKDGEIAILELQKEGKKRMNYKDFLNGNPNILGQKLS